MIEGSHGKRRMKSPLVRQLGELSAREQIEMLVRGMRALPNRERAEVLSATGIHFLTFSAINYVLRFLFKRFVRGVLWSVILGAGLIFGLIALVVLEQNPNFFVATVATVLAFFGGFLIYNIIDFCADIIPLFIRTTPKLEREDLERTLDNLEVPEKVAALRAMGLQLSGRFSGASIIEAILSGIVVSIASGVVIIVLLVASFIALATMGGSIAGWLPWVVGIIAFACGYVVPKGVQNKLSSMLQRKRKVAKSEQD